VVGEVLFVSRVAVLTVDLHYLLWVYLLALLDQFVQQISLGVVVLRVQAGHHVRFEELGDQFGI
jgi:hypothetical protein